jgi:hypothetical protein
MTLTKCKIKRDELQGQFSVIHEFNIDTMKNFTLYSNSYHLHTDTHKII